jgi:hypothetical protein
MRDVNTFHAITTHPQMAWVVFSDNSDLPFLRFLKKGFKHCYILLSDGQKWFSIDPMSHMTEIGFHDFNRSFNLPSWLKSQGHTVIKVGLGEPIKKPSPLMFSSCVETVKRLLGVQSRCVVTPWQLYKYIKKGASYGKSNIKA